MEIKKAANDEEANFIIELVKDETTKDLNFGSFKYMGNYVPTINEKSEMEKTENKFVVFGALTKIDQRYYFIRMILKSMGFSKYTYESESSIFFARTNNTLKIGKSDAKIIKVFYTKEIKPGMTKDQVDHLFGLN
ncbi:MAG: hypothetical protein EOO91_11190 [Pedobacter sp.]|nr:MAG: hypothetical protein EOO91_11190 [Pedobacter sp.]